MINSWTRLSTAAVALGFIGALPPLGTADAAQSRAVDLGTLAANAGDQTITVTLALKLNDLAGAEDMMRRMSTRGDPLFQQFLSPDQALAKFGPSQATVDTVTSQLRLAGLSVERASGTTLSVTGKASTLERVFQTSLHLFQPADTAQGPLATFRAAVGKPVVPAGIAPAVSALVGFSTQPTFHPHLHYAPDSFAGGAIQAVAPNAASGNPPGQLTVLDFAAHYNVTPLYNAGVTGKGRTVGIVTLANFTPSDAFTYWSSLGLKVDANRLTVVNIDGGPGAPSDASGSDETTLDVEQSGGIAPGAKIIVYQAPNTNQGFLDAFAAAIEFEQGGFRLDQLGRVGILRRSGARPGDRPVLERDGEFAPGAA